MAEEKLSFQAEVSRLLDIVANALYSNKEIFLRELISNASDACDRLRYAAQTDSALLSGEPDFKIRLRSDSERKTLIIEDNGIGMSRDDLIENLGTIAQSGTAAFVAGLEDQKEGGNLIGQFGVGFYSAFMVADSVEVLSRKAGAAEAWSWISDGKGSFTVSESEDAPARGTRITLNLREDAAEFLEAERLRHIVKTYSDHIAVPIVLEAAAEGENGEQDQTVNTASALWTRSKSEISDEQYKEFYHHVAHAFDDPWLRLHFKVEGVMAYTGLMFVPSSKPFDLFHPDRKNRMKLYVRRVFITDDCPELLPPYLRFLRGIVDTEDLPLNISREMLQHNPMLIKIRKALCKRVIGELQKKAEKAPEEFATFWENFGPVLKEGIYEDQDQRDALLELARFRSTAGNGLTSLPGYLESMKEGQDAIYYITGENLDSLLKSPQLEGFAAKGVDVLLLTDPVDEFWLSMVPDFKGKPLKSATRGGADLDKIAKADKGSGEADESEAKPVVDTGALIALIKLTLKDEIKDVRTSNRLTTSAVCLVADENDIDMHMERLLKQHGQLDRSTTRILEINPDHPMIRTLVEQVGKDGADEKLETAAHLLLDQARIIEGEPLPDPAAFAARMAKMVELGVSG